MPVKREFQGLLRMRLTPATMRYCTQAQLTTGPSTLSRNSQPCSTRHVVSGFPFMVHRKGFAIVAFKQVMKASIRC